MVATVARRLRIPAARSISPDSIILKTLKTIDGKFSSTLLCSCEVSLNQGGDEFSSPDSFEVDFNQYLTNGKIRRKLSINVGSELLRSIYQNQTRNIIKEEENDKTTSPVL